MGRHVPIVLLLAACVGLGFLLFGCSAPKSSTFDMKAPNVRQPRFTGPRQGWPPAVAGASDVRTVALGIPAPNRLTDAWRRRIYDGLPAHPAVRQALGRRFALTAIEEVIDAKGTADTVHTCHCHDLTDTTRLPYRCGHDCTPTRCRCREQEPGPLVDAQYFSYTFNAAVTVRARGLEVLGIHCLPGATPQIGPDERVRAVDLALQDRRVKKFMRAQDGAKLQAGVMLVVPRQGHPGIGHRIVYLTFARVHGDDPLLGVDIDLTDGKVLAVGPANGDHR